MYTYPSSGLITQSDEYAPHTCGSCVGRPCSSLGIDGAPVQLLWCLTVWKTARARPSQNRRGSDGSVITVKEAGPSASPKHAYFVESIYTVDDPILNIDCARSYIISVKAKAVVLLSTVLTKLPIVVLQEEFWHFQALCGLSERGPLSPLLDQALIPKPSIWGPWGSILVSFGGLGRDSGPLGALFGNL
jgi:hypothetical protein